MPDWREYVCRHLGALSLSVAETSEVVEELALHLEESYAALLATGMSEDEAFDRASSQVQDWIELRRKILAAKQEGIMYDRVKQVWVPGLVTLLTSYVALALFQWAGVRAMISHPGEPRAIFFYGPWVLCLPLIGAAGAYLSRRAQGTGWQVYFAASLPAVALGAFFLLLFPLTFVIDRQVPLLIKGTALGAGMISWVILPGVALCLGAALQGLRKMRIVSR